MRLIMSLEKQHTQQNYTVLNPISIAIYGRRNVGKSSLINLLTGQQTAIVSEIAGTTTDPVRKRTEINGIGVVSLIDTAGIDDEGEIGAKRVKKSLETTKQIDIAILVISDNLFGSFEEQLIELFEQYKIPFILLHNKSDISPLQASTIKNISQIKPVEVIEFSTLSDAQKELLVDKIKIKTKQIKDNQNGLFDGLLQANDFVLLITPIDEAAPNNRLILPQNQAIRSLLDNSCISTVIKETELEAFLALGLVPDLVVTDSKVFDYVAKLLPENIPLTSFSILFARQKGDFERYIEGTPYISQLQEGDTVLILESCTHHSSCDDIGRVKIPALLRKFSEKNLKFDVVAGLSELPKEINKYALVVQCGGCMITRKQLINRLKPFIENNIPITNYGMTLAYVNGMFERVISPLKKL